MLYLKGLNGIRTLAAFGVLYSHMRYWTHLGNVKSEHDLMGPYGVTMFFALSGFLITYLLLKEKDKQEGKIAIKKFYVRRILRIWPLYFFNFFLVLLTIIFFNREMLNGTLGWYAVMLANIPMALGIAPFLLVPYWSLATEEQFYLFWPWLIRIRNELKTLLIFLLIFVTFKVAIHVFINNNTLDYFIDLLRFDCMAIGGIGAVILSRFPEKLKIIYHPVLQLICWGFVLAVAINKFHIFSIIDHDIFAVVSTILIINQCSNPKVIMSLENKVFNFLGKISFGIYVYHSLVIYAWVSLFSLWGYSLSDNANWLFYVGVTISTILTAELSYEYFESIFLRKRNKFAVIQSSNTNQKIETRA